MKNLQSPTPSRAIVFYIVQLPLEKLPQNIYFNAASFAKIIITCENNYSRESNQPFIVDVGHGSGYASGFEYASYLNIAGFRMYQGCEYDGVLDMLLVLNMPGF